MPQIVIVIDEFHHAAAETYRSLLSRVTPSELLGLTATPERSDGADILMGRAGNDWLVGAEIFKGTGALRAAAG